MSQEIQRYADVAMFDAAPFDDWDDTKGVMPKVHLLWMTPQPLAALAAANEMYKGRIITSLNDVDDDAMQLALDDMHKTHLTAPLEFIKVHFIIEGVDRAFTHQHVRQRTAVFAQESLRFAVVQDLKRAVTLPPSLQGTVPEDTSTPDGKQRQRWDQAIEAIQTAYESLVANGMPQEDARGLLPHATATRLHYATDIRNLAGHAGNRLCTQAQFHWRSVFGQIIASFGEYGDEHDPDHAWQYHELSEALMWRPACWQQGKCAFKGSADRHCSIRDRVDQMERDAVPPEEWDFFIPVESWMLDPESARTTEV